MHAVFQSIKSAAPPAGAVAVGWPWWAITLLLVASCGPAWVMAWLDVIDRVRGVDTTVRREAAARSDPPQE